jgi:hypothetical protein
MVYGAQETERAVSASLLPEFANAICSVAQAEPLPN